MSWIVASFLLIGIVIYSTTAQDPRPSIICSLGRHEDLCAQIQRGNSEVNCRRVQDSIECAQLIGNGTADFGVFTAESALQIAALGWPELTVVKELRHRDRRTAPVDFESVVVVKQDHANGIDGLRGGKFCHPGLFYDRTQRWSERFLKHFERSVVPVECQQSSLSSPAALEAAALASHFSEACRPGLWSNNLKEDAELKQLYPSLCSLCNSQPGNCSYNFEVQGSHQQALQCLNARGSVAYVSLQEAQRFFSQDDSGLSLGHRYLCTDGSLQTIENNTSPCVWLRQPWKLIISSSGPAVQMAQSINRWMSTTDNSNWEFALREIIEADSFVVNDVTIQLPRDYFRPYRSVPLGQTLCSTQTTWCTSSLEELQKCEVIRAGGMTTGVYPLIECVEQTNGVVGCLREVSAGRSDLTGIDSNFGYLARHPYNLSTALFAETESNKYSSVVVIIKTTSSVERFENLKGQRACFAEFSGIAAMSFINTGKNRGFFQRSECNYGRMLSDFFGSSCAPGAQDFGHDPNATNSDSLCSLCRMNITSPIPTVAPIAREGGSEGGDVADGDAVPLEGEAPPSEDDVAPVVEGSEDVTPVEERSIRLNCNADTTNRFYGNLGALRCLQEEGDVAILELQYLQEHAATLQLNEHDYRIICRNGSLASFTGFNVDKECALTTIVDGEVVARPNSSKLPGIINALNSFDKYFQVDPDFKMFNVFKGTKHLLFKDSTIGLVAPSDANELNQQVHNYKQLFHDLEICTRTSTASPSAAFSISAMLTVILGCAMLHFY